MAKLYTLIQEVRRHPSELLFNGTAWMSGEELSERAFTIADVLQRSGVRANDKVIIRINDFLEFTAALIAIWALGGIAVPLDRNRSKKDVIGCAEECEARHAIVDDTNLFDTEKELFLEIVVSGRALPSAETKACSISFAQEDAQFPLIMYSSGTTGGSKGIMWRGSSIGASIQSLTEVLGINPSTRLQTVVPKEVPAALLILLMPCLSMGCPTYFMADVLPKPIIKGIEDFSPGIFFSTPFTYAAISKTRLASQLRELKPTINWISSGAKLTKEVSDGFHKATGFRLSSLYGATEAGVLTYNRDTDRPADDRCVGKPLPGVTLQIRDEAGKTMPGEEVGRIVVSDSNVRATYLARPSLNASVFSASGTILSDLGFLDRDGFLYIVGRASDTLNIGGYQVNLTEVEERLLNSSIIDDVVAIPTREK